MDVRCIFCHGTFSIQNEVYFVHLRQFHRLVYDVNHVYERTLQLQASANNREKISPESLISEDFSDDEDFIIDESSAQISSIDDKSESKENYLKESGSDLRSQRNSVLKVLNDVPPSASSNLDPAMDMDNSDIKVEKDFEANFMGNNQGQREDLNPSNLARIGGIKEALNALQSDSENDEYDEISIDDEEYWDENEDYDNWKANENKQNIVVNIKKEPIEAFDNNVGMKRKFDSTTLEESAVNRVKKFSRLELDEECDLISNIKVEEPHIMENQEINIQQTTEKNKSANIAENIPWFSGTLYSCQHCSKQFIEEEFFKEHIETSLNVPYENYLEQYGDESVEMHLHECEECGLGVKWHKQAIESHLMNDHKLSLDAYYEQNMGEIELPWFNITDETLLVRYRGNFNLKKVQDQHSWANRCIYKCNICGSRFRTARVEFKRHILSAHHKLMEDYTKEHGKSLDREETHFCRIDNCGYQITWEQGSINFHLKFMHNSMSLQDYQEQCLQSEPEINSSPSNSSSYLASWANRCIYKCNICAMTFEKARYEFERHMPTVHKITIGEYTKEHGKSMQHEEKHSCQVEHCNSKITWERGYITNHVKTIHEMSLQDYETKYMSTYKEKEEDIDWSNKCIFRCVICQKEFNSHSKFGTHVTSQHQQSLTEYSKQHGKTVSHEEKHSCQVELCSAVLMWDRAKISSHLRNVHDAMSIDEYKDKYMDNYVEKESSVNFKPKEVDVEWSNKCIFKCVICEREFNSHSKFGTHVLGHHQQSLTEYNKQHGKTVSHEEKHCCQIESCNAVMMWDRAKITSHLRNVHESLPIEEYKDKYMDNYVEKESSVNSKPFNSSLNLQTFTWANRCLFKCHICQIDINSKHSFEYHIKAKHSLLVSEYTKQFGNAISYEERHSCQVENCNAFLRWDKTAIYNHIRDVHNKMSLEEYEKKYMTDYKEKGGDDTIKTQTFQLDQDRYSESHFSCKVCTTEKVFHSRSKANQHMKTAHKMNLKDHREKYGRSLSFKVNHVCQICAGIILWDKDSIRSHLYGVHDKTSLEEYFNKYIDNFNDENEWLNKIVLNCKECKENKFEANNRHELFKHVKAAHELNEMEYRINHGSIYGPDLPESHTCQVCFVRINWESISLKAHIEMKHGMTANEYVDTYRSNYQDSDGVDITCSTENADTEWANMCTFQCDLCQKLFNSRSKFGTHVNSQHQKSMTEYTRLHGKSVLHEERHSCQIESCNAQMFWDRSTIKTHLRNVHANLSIETYKDNYMDNYVEKEKSKTLNLSNTSASEASWANRCIYRCNICGMTFKNSRYEFERHVSAVHNTSMGDYTKEHGKTMEHEEKHSCQVEDCNSKITWEKGYLTNHVKTFHEMTLQEYEEKYMSTYAEKESNVPVSQPESSWANRCLFKCALCETEVNNRGVFEYHLKSKHTIQVKEYMTNYGKTLSHEEFHSCQIDNCNSQIWWDRTSIKSHIYKAHDKMQIEDYKARYMNNYIKKEACQPESSWANRCIFKCSLCDLEVNNKSSFEYHLKTKHSLPIKEYLTRYGKTFSREERHRCQIENCSSTILWDRTAINAHLYGVHEKMSIEEYEKNYMENYKENQLAPATPSGLNITQDKYSECKFSCSICEPEQSFNSRAKVASHLKSVHKINLQYYHATYGSTISYQVDHTCHICAATVLWDKGAIRSHLYGVHDQMPLHEYFENYIDTFNENTDWMNKINFECKECSKSNGKFLTKTRGELWKHMENTHKMNEMEYRTIHGSIYGPDPPVSHNCQVCKVQVNWESIALKPHIELKHEITVDQYVNRFRDSYEEKKPGRETRLTQSRDRNVDKAEKYVNEEGRFSNIKESIGDVRTSNKEESSSSGPRGNASSSSEPRGNASSSSEPRGNASSSLEPKGNASSSSEVSNWAAGCLYLCKECNKSIPGLNQFKKHLVIRHKVEYKQYERKYQAKDFILFAGFHICKVCNKNVKHDTEFLKNHMEEHGISIQKYMNDYSPKPPKLKRLLLEMKKKT